MAFSVAEIKLKIEHYCAYQERCHKEVRTKLYSYGITPDEVENHISELIQSGFLNEERFAKAFAGGKFRTKHWGRVKIKIELKKRHVSPYNIQKAMQEITDKDYQTTFHLVSEKKLRMLKSEQPFARKKKLTSFLLSKGFEAEMLSTLNPEIFK